MFIIGAGSYMPLRFRLPYRAPRLLLQGLQAGTRLSSEFMPGSFVGQRSTSIRWSAVVACLALHQWHSGLSFNSLRLFSLKVVLLLVCWFSVRLCSWLVLWVLRRVGI